MPVLPINSQSTSGSDFVSREELLKLCALDGDFFAHHFFPRTFRSPSPSWANDCWRLLDSPLPEHEKVGLEIFRDGAKTTLCRGWIAKCVSYATTNCTGLVSLSQRHSIYSLRWLKKQIEQNRAWTDFYGLAPGTKWTDEELEIYNRHFGCSIYILAFGITGQSRGLNVDDYRPDTIILDDICDLENTKTKDQRDKTDDYVYGTLLPGMAAPGDAVRTKVAALQTCIMSEDFISKCHRDPSWFTVKMSCFRESSENPSGQESTWPERFPTPFLLRKKQEYTARNQSFFWLREMECTLVSRESACFLTENLKYYSDIDLPAAYLVFGGIDPARKKSDKPHNSAIVKIALAPPKLYVLEYYVQKRKDPEELWIEFLRMFRSGPRPTRIRVETVAYQQMLSWYFRKRMQETGQFFVIEEFEGDKRSKDQRIRDNLSGIIANGELYIRSGQTQLLQYLALYTGEEDIDLLDALAQAVETAMPFMRFRLPISGVFDVEDESLYEDLPKQLAGGCP